jgi:hypothetical protein
MVAVACVAILQWLLPAELAAGPGWLGVVLIAALAAAAYVFPHWHHWFGFAASGFITIALGNAVYSLIADLAAHRGQPKSLLFGALLIWSMNVLVFATWYWRLDAGGPRQRLRQGAYESGSFLFPQVTTSRHPNWQPHFIDYLFLAFNASTAFSPTDSPVLSPWAKVLMMIQSSIALATLAVVAARAVNIL